MFCGSRVMTESPTEGFCLHIKRRKRGGVKETAAPVGNHYYVMKWSLGGSTGERVRHVRLRREQTKTAASLLDPEIKKHMLILFKNIQIQKHMMLRLWKASLMQASRRSMSLFLFVVRRVCRSAVWSVKKTEICKSVASTLTWFGPGEGDGIKPHQPHYFIFCLSLHSSLLFISTSPRSSSSFILSTFSLDSNKLRTHRALRTNKALI